MRLKNLLNKILHISIKFTSFVQITVYDTNLLYKFEEFKKNKLVNEKTNGMVSKKYLLLLL